LTDFKVTNNTATYKS